MLAPYLSTPLFVLGPIAIPQTDLPDQHPVLETSGSRLWLHVRIIWGTFKYL